MAAVLLFGVIGIVALQSSGAASFQVASETEVGMPAGNASKVSSPGASAGQAVQFGQAGGGSTATYPLKVSSNKRYLVGQNDVPFLMVGDTAWNMSAKLTDAEIAQYMDARKNQGFNTILTSLMDINKGSMGNTVNRAGVRIGSFSSPNGAYFDHIVNVLNMAKDRGMQLAILPAWSQHADKDGSYTTGTAASWGTFAANKFKNSDNLIWVMGGDYGGSPEGDCPLVSEMRTMANAIEAADGRHLITTHAGINQSSNLCHSDQPWLDFATTYWDFDYGNVSSVYRNTVKDHGNSPTRPTVSFETGYEGPWGDAYEDQLTTLTSRQQSAYQVLGGGLGFTYGANSTYEMKDNEGKTWRQTITEKGGVHQGFVAKAFLPRQWWNLVPDQNRTVLIGGNSNSGSKDFAAAARTADGSLVMVYTPSSRTMTIDMSKLSATATARWYDPTNSQYRAITGSPFPNSGSRQFATPGNNADGNPDWILVIETNPPAGT